MPFNVSIFLIGHILLVIIDNIEIIETLTLNSFDTFKSSKTSKYNKIKFFVSFLSFRMVKLDKRGNTRRFIRILSLDFIRRNSFRVFSRRNMKYISIIFRDNQTFLYRRAATRPRVPFETRARRVSD